MNSVKKHPTKVQFDEIKWSIELYNQCYLKIDGYLICAQIKPLKMKLFVYVYVNGVMSGKDLWRGKDSELGGITDIARKFQSLCSKRINSAASIKALEKHYGKRNAEKEGVYAKYYYTQHSFSTAGAFIAHVKKHNDSIEILSLHEYNEAMKALNVGDGNE